MKDVDSITRQVLMYSFCCTLDCVKTKVDDN